MGRSLGGAVDRNRIKRVLRDEVRRRLHVLAPVLEDAPCVLTFMIVVRRRPSHALRLRKDAAAGLVRLSDVVGSDGCHIEGAE